jgi:outer membrane receptor protein involved in Fe transport
VRGPQPERLAGDLRGHRGNRAQYGHIVECPSDTCSALSGGNRALKPETANTYTAGIVFTPKFLRRFSLSVDYYNIKVKDYISSMAPSLIMGQCAQTGDPYFCGLFKRDARSGALFGQNAGYVISTTMNTGYLKTSGLDFNADYTVGLGKAGSLNMNLVGTYLLNQIAQPVPGLGSYDCNGLFGYTCGQPSPTWRHVARFTWMTPTDTVLSLSWRHIGGTRLSSLTDNPAQRAADFREQQDQRLQLLRSVADADHQQEAHPARGREQPVRQGSAAARSRAAPALRQRQHLSGRLRCAGPHDLRGGHHQLLIVQTLAPPGPVRSAQGPSPFSGGTSLAPPGAPPERPPGPQGNRAVFCDASQYFK